MHRGRSARATEVGTPATRTEIIVSQLATAQEAEAIVRVNRKKLPASAILKWENAT
jgi:hypothetical protein